MSYFLATVDDLDCLRHLSDDIYQELQSETIFVSIKLVKRLVNRKNVDTMAVAYLMLLYLQ